MLPSMFRYDVFVVVIGYVIVKIDCPLNSASISVHDSRICLGGRCLLFVLYSSIFVKLESFQQCAYSKTTEDYDVTNRTGDDFVTDV
jgi:hypothetical protein